MKLFSSTIATLENAINYANTNQRVIAQNIANVDTPNYKAKEVSFKDSLAVYMKATKTNDKHIDFTPTDSTVKITSQKGLTYNNSGNNVDMEKEMHQLATNQIYYNALIDRVSGKFNSLENVIRGGK